MATLKYSDLNSDNFQSVIVCSTSSEMPAKEWAQRIIENSKYVDEEFNEFRPDYENGLKILRFDLGPFKQCPPIRCHQASLDNKYYSTNIYLMELEQTTEFPTEFYPNIHGIVLYASRFDQRGMEEIEKWVEYIDAYMENCSIRLLCYQVTDDNEANQQRGKIKRFCAHQGIEPISMTALPDVSLDDDEEYDEETEICGYPRIYNALQAYVWPNLNYKSRGNAGSYISPTRRLEQQRRDLINQFQQLKVECGVKVESKELEEGLQQNVTSDESSSKKPEESVSKEITESEADSFESLFGNLADIKNQAEQLSDEERKNLAEKLTIQFWNSIGGDPSEIAGILSDEEEKKKPNRA